MKTLQKKKGGKKISQQTKQEERLFECEEKVWGGDVMEKGTEATFLNWTAGWGKKTWGENPFLGDKERKKYNLAQNLLWRVQETTRMGFGGSKGKKKKTLHPKAGGLNRRKGAMATHSSGNGRAHKEKGGQRGPDPPWGKGNNQITHTRKNICLLQGGRRLNPGGGRMNFGKEKGGIRTR